MTIPRSRVWWIFAPLNLLLVGFVLFFAANVHASAFPSLDLVASGGTAVGASQYGGTSNGGIHIILNAFLGRP